MFVLLVGLPAAGKTTYLGALWESINATEVPSSLSLTKLAPDISHIEKIHSNWSMAELAVHTTPTTAQPVDLLLKLPNGEDFSLTIPDLAGDDIVSYLSHRDWPADFDATVQDADGILMLLNADKVTPHGLLDEAIELEQLLEEKDESSIVKTQAEGATRVDPKPSGAPENPESEAPLSEQVQFNAETVVPTEVRLVDLLQELVQRNTKRPVRVALLVSAWDLVSARCHDDPEEWLAKDMPLLSQFLQSNNDLFESAIYGVSAQGGMLPNQQSTLLETPPYNRPRIVGATVSHERDLSQPIFWLLEGSLRK